MWEYRFSLIHILPYKDRNVDTGEYGSVKAPVFGYLRQCPIHNKDLYFWGDELIKLLAHILFSESHIFNNNYG